MSEQDDFYIPALDLRGVEDVPLLNRDGSVNAYYSIGRFKRRGDGQNGLTIHPAQTPWAPSHQAIAFQWAYLWAVEGGLEWRRVCDLTVSIYDGREGAWDV